MNTTKEVIKWSFVGRFAMVQRNIAENAMRFLGCTKAQAERLANAFASDYGNWVKVAKDNGLKLKYGAPNKDEHFTITQIDEIETLIKAPSPALSIVRSLYVADKAFTLKSGYLRDECQLTLVARLNNWLFQAEDKEVQEKETIPLETVLDIVYKAQVASGQVKD